MLRLFIPAGKVIDVQVLRYRFRSRGMGYVEFETLEEGIKAHQMFHNHKLVDRTIIVDFAQPDLKPKFEDKPEGQRRPPERLHSTTRRSSPVATKRHTTFHRRSDSGHSGRHGRK